MNVNMQVTMPDVQNYADMTTGFRNGSAVGNSGFADLLIKTGKSDDKLMNADSSAKSRISDHMTSVTSRQQRSSRLSGTDRASGRNRSAETAKTDSTVSWGQQSTDAAVISASMQTQADVRQHEKADAARKAVQQVDATGSTASVQAAEMTDPSQEMQTSQQTADMQMAGMQDAQADPSQDVQSAQQMQLTQAAQQMSQTADRQMMQGAAEAADPTQEMQSATQMQAAEMQNVQQTQGTQPADMQLMQGTADAAEDPSQEMQSTAQTHAAQMQNMQQTQSTRQLSETTDRQMMQGAAEAAADPSQEMQNTVQTQAVQMQTSQQMQDAQQLSQTADAQNAATADLAQGTQSTQQLQAAQTQTAGTQQTPSAQQNSIRQYDVSEAQMTDAAAAENVAKTAQPEKKESFRSGTEEQDADSSAAFGKKTASEEPEIVNAAEAQLRSNSLFAKDMSAAGSTQTAEVSTTRAAMTEDIADYLAAHFPQKNGTFQIELNPQNLGRVMIRVVYETGRAVVSIAASQADTMRMLSQNAQQMGNILRDATGEETTVVVPETSAQNQQDNATNTEARSQNRREADESPDHDKNRRSQSDEFLNRMRLGIV